MSETRRPCPRKGCTATMGRPDMIVCTGDFHALAGMCRGKKRLGEPEATIIQDRGRGSAYQCPLCLQFHNGQVLEDPRPLVTAAKATVRALKADPRVGWQGILQLADAWAPSETMRRVHWAQGLDQRQAFALAS